MGIVYIEEKQCGEQYARSLAVQTTISLIKQKMFVLIFLIGVIFIISNYLFVIHRIYRDSYNEEHLVRVISISTYSRVPLFFESA